MIQVGRYNQLKVLRKTEPGIFLGDEEGEDVLLPNKYCRDEFEIDDILNVFVYRDFEERKVAVTIDPKIKLHEFAFLRVTDVSKVGAFMDWGMEKELMVPFKEQRQNMEVGRWYVVYLDLDEKTDRLYASNKLDKFLWEEEPEYDIGEEVRIIVVRKTDLGYSVIVENKYKGLIFESDIYKEINIGDVLPGYVRKVREDFKLDIVLQPLGFKNVIKTNEETILEKLSENNGSLPLTDKTAPEEIAKLLGMSKKAFKKSIGTLYKQRKIKLEKDGIKLL